MDCLLDVSRWEGSGICENATRYKMKGIAVNVARLVSEIWFLASEFSSSVAKGGFLNSRADLWAKTNDR
jgi:hypothetical protein